MTQAIVNTLTLTVGVSAAGKSTWINQITDDSDMRTHVVERDQLRLFIQNYYSKLNATDYVRWPEWQWKNERIVNMLVQFSLSEAIKSGVDHIIFAETNLLESKRRNVVDMVERLGFKPDVIQYKFFPISLEEAIERDSKRAAMVGADVIRKQFSRLDLNESKVFTRAEYFNIGC